MNKANIESDLRKVNLINVDQWNKAKWRGVGYIYGGGKPPSIVLAFENATSASKLFRDLIARVGNEDTNRLLRISFVEGPVPGEDPGYTVLVGTDIDNILSDLASKGQGIDTPTITGFLTRPLRCNISPRLEQFQAEFARFNQCFVVPGDLTGQPTDRDCAILTGNIVFRSTEQITSKQDPDYAVFAT